MITKLIMGITLRLGAGEPGQQARGTKITSRCKEHLKNQLGDALPPHTEGKETTLTLEALSIWAIVSM